MIGDPWTWSLYINHSLDSASAFFPSYDPPAASSSLPFLCCVLSFISSCSPPDTPSTLTTTYTHPYSTTHLFPKVLAFFFPAPPLISSRSPHLLHFVRLLLKDVTPSVSIFIFYTLFCLLYDPFSSLFFPLFLRNALQHLSVFSSVLTLHLPLPLLHYFILFLSSLPGNSLPNSLLPNSPTPYSLLSTPQLPTHQLPTPQLPSPQLPTP